MSQRQPSGASQSFHDRALAALSDEAPAGPVRSCFARGEQYCLFASQSGAFKGVELLLEFPEPEDGGVLHSLDMPFELCVDGRAIFSGVWTTDVKVDGERLQPTDRWETLCVDPAERYAFCERSIPLVGGRRLSRRILLSYNESLLVIADDLVPDDAERGDAKPRELRVALPFAADVVARQDAEARETTLLCQPHEAEPVRESQGAAARKAPISEEEELLYELDEPEEAPRKRETVVARVFPLGLPEWQADASRGELRITSANELELTTLASDSALFAPLVFDFNARRAARPCAWRELTVGEKRKAAAANDAFGRRLQLGAEQYVLYASTSQEPAIRSVLSRNLISDFMFGKFLASRGVVPIVDVNGEENDEEESASENEAGASTEENA